MSKKLASAIKTAKKFALVCLVSATVLLGACRPAVLALSEAQQLLFDQGISYYDVGAGGACDGNDGVSADSSGSASGSWNSGLQPPYIVEQFAINVLEDLAQKKGATSADAVTPQHVLALVSWALLEGGDINNSSLFNLYNTGYSSPDLDAGAHTADGLGSYKSFDAGVEATARTLASGHGGMVNVLLDPNSTALDFAHAESYSGTNTYPGTEEWAGAANSNPAAYEAKWKIVLQSVSSNYANTAALIIGTSDFEAIKNETDPSKLSGIFKSSDDATASIGTSIDSGCTASGGVVQGNIVQTALGLAWPTSGHGNQQADATPAYQTAMPQYDGATGDLPYSDCGVFVATVMIGSGADPNYPRRGTTTQMPYLESSSKYTEVPNQNDTSNLQPGDIFINSQHTYIYTGPQPSGYNAVGASLGTHVPEATNVFFDEAGEPFKIFRYIGGSS